LAAPPDLRAVDNGGELVDELCHFQYDTSSLVLPVFNTDFAAALKALEIAAFGFDINMPELDWGPENFKELSRDLQTCTVLLAFLKSAITVLGYVLAAGDLISPSVGIAAAASGKILETPEKKTGCLARRLRSCCCRGSSALPPPPNMLPPPPNVRPPPPSMPHHQYQQQLAHQRHQQQRINQQPREEKGGGGTPACQAAVKRRDIEDELASTPQGGV
jgi:hypothetical protein